VELEQLIVTIDSMNRN